MGSSPKIPPSPPPPAPPAQQQDPAVLAARTRERRRQLALIGRRSTITTGPQGVPEGRTLGAPTLLGGGS